MMLLVIIECEKFQYPEKRKLCLFSVILGKFNNITNIECGSGGTNKIFDHP